MKPCPDGNHDFVAHEPRSMWGNPFIYCRKCGVIGPFRTASANTTSTKGT